MLRGWDLVEGSEDDGVEKDLQTCQLELLNSVAVVAEVGMAVGEAGQCV